MIVILNHKSNLNKEEFINYIEELNKLNTKEKIIICPNYLNIPSLPDKYLIGSQNVSKTSNGSYTGEISAEQLKSYSVKYSLVGHSERRKNYNESLIDINSKIKELLNNDITPILCIGETKEEKDNNKIKEVLKIQLETALNNIEDKEKIVIAYEPVWAIGTGLTPTIEEIENTITYIKELVNNQKIVYGGSVNETNIDTLKNISNIDGYLLGGLSLKPIELKKFLEKIDYIN